MVKPNLAFVNFFREKRGKRVVEVKDIVVPEGDPNHPDGWPRHHADFDASMVYEVQWAHLPTEDSFSTTGLYEAKILCFGVTMEDLQHEANSTGFKIPAADVTTYGGVGLAPIKPKSPAGNLSKRGRRLTQVKSEQSVAPPSHSRKKKKSSTDEDLARRNRSKEFLDSLKTVPFPASVTHEEPDENYNGNTSDQDSTGSGNSKGQSRDKCKGNSSSDPRRDTKSPRKSSTSKKDTKVDGELRSSLARSASVTCEKPDGNCNSNTRGQDRTGSGNSKGQSGDKCKGNSSSDPCRETQSPRSSILNMDTNVRDNYSDKTNVILSGTESEGEIVQHESSKIETECDMPVGKGNNVSSNYGSGRKAKKRYREDPPSSDDEDGSYESSTDASQVLTDMYVTKILKLEGEVKSLRRQLALKEKSTSQSPPLSGSNDGFIISSPLTPTSDASARPLADTAKRSLFVSPAPKPSNDSGHVDNVTISQMIMDAINNKAPLRGDGTGKVHLGNGVYVSARLFEEKIKASKVSPSVAVRDVMGSLYTTSQLACRSLEGGTPVKGGVDRKKLKKQKLTPAKRECLLGLYRAKTSLKTGSTDNNFLTLSVDKQGKSTVRDKLKEAAKKIRVEEAARLKLQQEQEERAREFQQREEEEADELSASEETD